MALLTTRLLTITLLFVASSLTITGAGAAEPNNAQAGFESHSSGTSETAASGSESNEPINVVRRYVPRFVGKRQPEPVDKVTESKDNEQTNEDWDLDVTDEVVEDFVQYLSSIADNTDTQTGNTNGIGNSESEPDQQEISVSDKIVDSEVDHVDYPVDEASFMNDDEFDIDTKTQEDKRYQPTFVGKRRYKPMFVGKRYRPMFVGKRYQPMFVGKRYQPMFVGKRYQPTFVGKRYQPTFVGKRYQPTFVGKRYQPTFVGKRYQPTFVGKRYQPTFVGKRYQPTFVGKRYTPRFIGKRFTPSFVGKRDSTENQEVDTDKVTVRRKRSVTEENAEFLKRAWGRYVPWHELAVFKGDKEDGEKAYKRFVAPEFIGRRDSLSSILNALDALQYIRHPTSTSKRFEAPMFIGKRPFTPTFVGKRAALRPMFVGRRSAYTSDMSWGDQEQDSNYGLFDKDDLKNQALTYSALAPVLASYRGYRGETE